MWISAYYTENPSLEDHASGASLVVLDPTRWETMDATFGQPTRHQTYRSDQLIIEEDDSGAAVNVLRLRAERKDPVPGDNYKWWSGGMWSRNTDHEAYPCFGRFEARMRIPHGQGSWPAFWLTHRDGGSTAEIDIMEYFHSQEPGRARSTLWLDKDNPGDSYSAMRYHQAYSFEAPTTTPGWHVFGVDIELTGGTEAAPTEVTFTFRLDGTIVAQHVESTHLTWLTDHLEHLDDMWEILVNHQIDGQYIGNPDGVLGYLDQVDECSLNASADHDPATACSFSGIQRIGNNLATSIQSGQDADFGSGFDFSVDYIRVYTIIEDAPPVGGSEDLYLGQPYLTGVLETAQTFPAFCRVEALIKAPHGQGLFPSLWMSHVNGPDEIEVGILNALHELRPGKNSTGLYVGSSLVNGAALASPNVQTGDPFVLYEAPSLTPAWHYWGLDISRVGGTASAPTSVKFTFYLDRRIYHTVTLNDEAALAWVNSTGDRAHVWKVGVGLFIDGTWVGDPDGRLGFLDQQDKCASDLSTSSDGAACAIPTNIMRAGRTVADSLVSDQDAVFSDGINMFVDYVKVYSNTTSG